jgi:hypothetical protein
MNIDIYSELSEYELFTIVGENLISDDKMGDFNVLNSPEKLYQLGKKWFLSNINDLQSKICNSKIIAELTSEQNSNKKELIIAIGDVIAGITIGFPPLLIANLIVKIGVEQFCRAKDNTQNENQ